MKEVNDSVVRALAIELLTDTNGLPADAWEYLYVLLLASNNEDIIECLKTVPGHSRYYLPEGVAEELA